MALPCVDIVCNDEDSDCSTGAATDETCNWSEPDSPGRPNAEAELEMLEEELRKPVEGLLEDLVRYQSEQNSHRFQLDGAHARYRQRLEQTSRLYEAMRAKHGSKLDRAKSHAEARRAEALIVEREEAAVRAFSAAAVRHAEAVREVRAFEDRLMASSADSGRRPLNRDDEDGLAQAVAQLARCTEERDHLEESHALVVQKRRAAEASSAASRRRSSSTESLEPVLLKLEGHQAQVAIEQRCIEVLERKAQGCKDALKHAMRELERISESVHEARAEHKSRVSGSGTAVGDSGASLAALGGA